MGRRCRGIHINIGTCVGSTNTHPAGAQGQELDVCMGWGPERGPGSWGRCWLCTSSCNECPPEEFLSLFPALILSAHSSQGAPTELPGHGSDLTERFLTLSEKQKLLPLPLPAHPRNAEGAGTKAGRSSWSSANPQVFPRRGVQEGVGGSRLVSSSSWCRAGQDQSFFSPHPATSVPSCILTWNTQPALPS